MVISARIKHCLCKSQAKRPTDQVDAVGVRSICKSTRTTAQYHRPRAGWQCYMIKSENIDLRVLAERYRETAGYYVQEEQAKQHFVYLLNDLKKAGYNVKAMEEVLDNWTV